MHYTQTNLRKLLEGMPRERICNGADVKYDWLRRFLTKPLKRLNHETVSNLKKMCMALDYPFEQLMTDEVANQKTEIERLKKEVERLNNELVEAKAELQQLKNRRLGRWELDVQSLNKLIFDKVLEGNRIQHLRFADPEDRLELFGHYFVEHVAVEVEELMSCDELKEYLAVPLCPLRSKIADEGGRILLKWLHKG